MLAGEEVSRHGRRRDVEPGCSIITREDGFIDATQLCKAGGRKFNDWRRLKSTTELVNALAEELQAPRETLIVAAVGGNHSGSWIHPLLAIHLAMWISPKFGIQVSRWVCEWRALYVRNEEEYQFQLAHLEPGLGNDAREKKARDIIRETELGDTEAEVEVETAVGFIDLLTNTRLIEIKIAQEWKHAVGQLLCYSEFFPDRELWLYLFDCEEEAGDPTEQDLVDQICGKHGIKVRRIVVH